MKTLLVDIRNFAEVLPKIITEIQATKIVGLDCETEDSNRHAGLTRFCKYDDEGQKSKTAPLVFDMQRIVVTGFSIYPEDGDTAYYFNLAHADVENRIPWAAARMVLDARTPGTYFISHNAAFELAALGNGLGYEIEDIICTLQLAVCAYGPDDFDPNTFRQAGLGGLRNVVPPLMQLSATFNALENREPKGALATLVNNITSKEKKTDGSYNGFARDLNWGYGLKRAVETHFGVKMATFEETLGDKAHMGELTGEEVSAYGADDAYWAVRLFRKLLTMLQARAPNAVTTFFAQENPMVHVFADIWREGAKINLKAVNEARERERVNFAALLRELKVAIRATGGFRAEPDARLVKREEWYSKNHAKYRGLIWNWANSPDHESSLDQCLQMRSPVSNAWANDLGIPESKGPNLVHYMPQRTLMYDLLQMPLSVIKGKLQSDGECRGKLLEKANAVLKQVDEEDDEIVEELTGWKETAIHAVTVLGLLNKMSSLEQRMKLYLTPYLNLTDPDTKMVYPVVSSELATRRMAAKFPNGMQLAKRGESVYVRGFWEPDTEDHVIFSRDWSAIELVIIGEQSKDPEFAKVYGQIPHGDLHAGASADILSVAVPGLTEAMFHDLKRVNSADEFMEKYSLAEVTRLFTDLVGEPMNPKRANKYWRTEIGKGANFNYWYSGWLGTVGDRMGWNMDTTAEAVERYRTRFWMAEAWRRGEIESAKRLGYVELPDGLRRYRYEAMDKWRDEFAAKFPVDMDQKNYEGFKGILSEITRRIQKRAHNQIVNAKVQGTCATLAKRSILAIRERCKKERISSKYARFMMPVHDELVYSIHRDIVVDFEGLSRECMNTHPDLFPTLKVDSSPAIGLNFEPWNAKTQRIGQVELYEPPAEIVGADLADTRLDAKGIQQVTDWLFEERKRLAA